MPEIDSLDNSQAVGTSGATVTFNSSTDTFTYDTGAGSVPLIVAGDTTLEVTDNVLAMHNGTNAQELRVYNTNDEAGNAEWGGLRWDANSFKIEAAKSGTGASRQVVITNGKVTNTSPAMIECGNGNSGLMFRFVHSTGLASIGAKTGAEFGINSVNAGGIHSNVSGNVGQDGKFCHSFTCDANASANSIGWANFTGVGDTGKPAISVDNAGNGERIFELLDTGAVTFRPVSSTTPANNGDLTIEATNDTTLTLKLKGSDGTVRSGTITLS